MEGRVNNWEELTVARLLDFLKPSSPWHRSLWNPGFIIGLKEILEASEASQRGILGSDALNFIVSSTAKSAPSDVGVGGKGRLKALEEALKPKIRYQGLDFFAITEIAQDIEQDYLLRWAIAIESGTETLNPERTARAIASHLLDLGFSGDYLHRWLTFRFVHEEPRRTFPDIVREAHELSSAGPKSYEVLVGIASVPPKKIGRPDGWIEAHEVSNWLRSNEFETSGVRQRGGILVTIDARDAQAAADAAAESVDRLSARAKVATAGELRRLDSAWVRREKGPHAISPPSRGLYVRALIRENVVYRVAHNPDAVAAALEMLAPLQDSSPISAIASGWAAIEALLGEPNDRGSAAERLAALVSCSFPRAELTVLSYALERDDHRMAGRLSGVHENRDRAHIVAGAIAASESLTLQNPSDQAALERMKRLLRSPGRMLKDIQEHAEMAFRRLYRQRNLVLHGGQTNAVALRACLRTAAPLVGAGMDRIAHGYYANGTVPLSIAAKARAAITSASAQDPASCVDLLP